MGPQEQASFGDALREALEAAGVSQAKLAQQLNINQAQVSRWVNGKALPQAANLHTTEEFLNVDLSAAFNDAKPTYELFVSAPISGLADEDIPKTSCGS